MSPWKDLEQVSYINPKLSIMKNQIIVIAAIAFALCSCGGNNTNNTNDTKTTLFKAQTTLQDAFPQDCEKVCFQQGDLNNDGIQDLVIGATPRNSESEPVLAIYFGKEGGKYSLFKEYLNTLPVLDGSTPVTMESEITEKGVLKLDFDYLNTAGVAPVDNTSFLFRFQDGDFYLIGADWQSYNRITGEVENVSCNYLTKKQQTTISSVDEEVEPTETWTDLPDKPLEKLGDRMLD